MPIGVLSVCRVPPYHLDYLPFSSPSKPSASHEESDDEEGSEEDEESEEEEEEEDEEEDDAETDESEAESDAEEEQEDGDGESDAEKDGRTRAPAGRRQKLSSGVGDGNTLFIKNMSFDTDQETLKELFSQFGRVRYALLCVDPLTEHPRGTAFVQFAVSTDTRTRTRAHGRTAAPPSGTGTAWGSRQCGRRFGMLPHREHF